MLKLLDANGGGLPGHNTGNRRHTLKHMPRQNTHTPCKPGNKGGEGARQSWGGGARVTGTAEVEGGESGGELRQEEWVVHREASSVWSQVGMGDGSNTHTQGSTVRVRTLAQCCQGAAPHTNPHTPTKQTNATETSQHTTRTHKHAGITAHTHPPSHHLKENNRTNTQSVTKSRAPTPTTRGSIHTHHPHIQKRGKHKKGGSRHARKARTCVCRKQCNHSTGKQSQGSGSHTNTP